MFKIPVLKMGLFNLLKIQKFASEIPDTSTTRLGTLHFCMSEFQNFGISACLNLVILAFLNSPISELLNVCISEY